MQAVGLEVFDDSSSQVDCWRLLSFYNVSAVAS